MNQTITFAERVHWNTQATTFGGLFTIAKRRLQAINLSLAGIIVGLYPVFVAVSINKFFIKKDFKHRFETKQHTAELLWELNK